MKNTIKSLTILSCSALFLNDVLAQVQTNPINNFPVVVQPVTPTTVTYPGMNIIGSALPVNYVRTEVPDVPSSIITAGLTPYVRQSTAYVDGLDRPLQEVVKKVHADGYDLVQPHVYDDLGRETYHYQPYMIPLEYSTGKLNRTVNARMHH
ncbi:MAG: hypothetical protein EOO94_02680, partial [Pedobacter sp.]